MAFPQTQTVDHYKQPDATTLVLLHGGGLNRAMWRSQVDLLKDDFSLLLLDLPGHGSLRHTRFTLDTAVAQVAEVIAREAHGQVITVGLSLGGYVAMAHAAEHPDQVAGLVVSGSSVQYTGLMGLVARMSVAGMRLVSTDRYAQMQTSLLLRTLPTMLVEDIAGAGFSAQGSRDAMAAMIGRNFFSSLRDYPGALLIANGENDTLNRKYAAQSAALQRSSVEIIRHSGHLCSLEQPLAYSHVLRKFAASISNGGTRDRSASLPSSVTPADRSPPLG